MQKSILQEIEESFDVESIQSQNIDIWPFLRMQYFFEIQETLENMPKQSIRFKTIFKEFFKNFIPSLFLCFGKTDFVFLSSSNMMKLYPNDKYHNKNLKDIIDNIGPSYCLVEQVSMQDFDRDNQLTKNTLSYLFLVPIVALCSLFIKRPQIINETILIKINEKYKIHLNYRKKIKRFFARQKVFELFLKLKKCKTLFLTCYYSFQAEIAAAKNLNIPVIEMQHGVVGQKHPAYTLFKPSPENLFPDIFMTFGKHDKDIQDNAKFKLFKNVFLVGNNYVDVIKNQKKDRDYLDRAVSYEKLIVVSCQETLDEKMSPMIKEIAEKNPTYLFIMGIRMRPKAFYDKFNFPKNVWLENQKNIYELLLYADLHVTGYSTCTMESLCFGKRNLLLNINGFSKKYFADHMIDNKTTFVADTVEEFGKILQSINWKVNPKLCLEKGRTYFAPFDPLAFADVLNFAKTISKS